MAARFAGPAKQAKSVMKRLQGTHIESVGTVRNYEERLLQIATHLKDHRLGGLRDMTPASALDYLRQRASSVSQKTLDMERQAIQAMMQHVSNKLAPGQTLEVIKSTAPVTRKGPGGKPKLLAEQARAYSREQMLLVAARQAPHNALATEIAYAAGLRAHELITLRRTHHQAPDVRPAHELKFHGIRETTISYTVHGKGGLTREVRIPITLARRLEATRLEKPRKVRDRKVNYKQHYGIGGGLPWSKSFGVASAKALGWSNGAHGLRHSYAQERMHTVRRELPREGALRVVSQEMGHFRPSITEVYLR